MKQLRLLYPSILLGVGYALQAVLGRRPGDLLLLALLLLSLYKAYDFWRGAPIVFAAGSAVGFAFEVLGVHTGFPFGSYTYSMQVPSLAGVPVIIVVAWGIYLYTAFLSSMPLKSRRLRLLVAPAFMVLLDLGVDPVMVSRGLWSWHSGGPSWFGVPLSNFAGWYVVSLASLLVYRKAVREEPELPPQAAFTVLPAYLPVLREAPPEALLPALLGFSSAAAASCAVFALSRRR